MGGLAGVRHDIASGPLMSGRGLPGIGNREIRTPLVLAAFTFLFYVLTLAPTFSWGDSADLPLRVYGEPGAEAQDTARDYVLYRWIGKGFLFIPFGDVAYRINLMSATFSTIGVLAVYAMVRRRTGRADAGLVAALALACSHTWWWMSVVSEVYTFAASLILLALWCWLVWNERGGTRWLLAASLLSGLAASAHAAGVLFVVMAGWHLHQARGRLKRPALLLATGALLVGASFLIAMVLQALARGGAAGLREAIDSTNPGVAQALWRQAVKAVALLLYQYPLFATVLAGVGVNQMVRRGNAWDRMVVGTWLLFVSWATLSRIPDLFNAYAISFALVAPVIGAGAALVLSRLAARALSPRLVAAAGIVAVVATPMIVYTAVPAAAGVLRVDLTGARFCPERNNNWYFLFPPKRGDHGPRRFAESALDSAASRGVIIADYTLWRPLKFLQLVEGRRTDVDVKIVDPLLGGTALSEFVATALRSGPVYVAAIEPAGYYDIPQLRANFEISPAGSIFELRARP
jgi:hypothetical protein